MAGWETGCEIIIDGAGDPLSRRTAPRSPGAVALVPGRIPGPGRSGARERSPDRLRRMPGGSPFPEAARTADRRAAARRRAELVAYAPADRRRPREPTAPR